MFPNFKISLGKGEDSSMLKTTDQELDSVAKNPVITQRSTPMEKGRVTHTHSLFIDLV